MAKITRNVKVALAEVVVDRSRNVREQDDNTYRVDDLKGDLESRGQQQNAILEKDSNGKYFPIQGFLRSTALKELAAEGKIDPHTVKRDDKGEVIPGTGKPFSYIIADVWEDLTERERTNLLIDHGNRRSLTKVELFYALGRLFDALYSEKDIASMTKSLLEQHHPPTKQIEPGPDALLNYYRGVIQTNKEAHRAPTKLRQAWVEKLRGEHTWPTKAEMMDGVKIYKKEVDADKTMKLNKDNPGPLFLEWWERLVKKQAEAEANGESRGKSINMLSRGQVEDVLAGSNSRIIKAVCSVVLNNGKVDRAKMPTLDSLCVDFEARMTEEQLKVLESVFNVG